MNDNEDTIKQSEKTEWAIKEILNKINKITESCAGRSFIFRGESKEYSNERKVCDKREVTSGLYRDYCMPKLPKLEYFPALEMTGEIIDSAKEHFEEKKSTIGILTGLQHQGSKTALIDFTRSVYIALYFACNKHLNEDGWLFMIEEEKIENLGEDKLDKIFKTLPKEGLSKILENLNENEISDDDESKSKIYCVNPIGKEPRVIFQSSVFVLPVRGFLKKDDLCVIKIKKELKENILQCLFRYNGIEEKTIYNDLQGFIQRSPIDQYKHFYQATVDHKKKKYKEAIEKYSRAIEINSKYFEAYSNRGKAKSASGKYDEAIQDYSQALRINSEYAEAYFNRGKAKSALDKYDEAIQDYSQALRIKPEHADAYFNRGNSKFALGMRHESKTHYEDAIKDYDQSLEFKPEYILAYIKRAIANDKCDKRPEAIEDFKQALRLSRQQGDEEMAKKIEVLLRALEGNPKNSPTDQ